MLTISLAQSHLFILKHGQNPLDGLMSDPN